METNLNSLEEPVAPLMPERGNRSTHMEVFGVVSRNNQNYWTRIGTAFQNRDGSWNVLLDYVPTKTGTTIQLREPRERPERGEQE